MKSNKFLLLLVAALTVCLIVQPVPGNTVFTSFLISYHYIITCGLVINYQPVKAYVQVYFGDPSAASPVIGKVQKMVANGKVTLIKSCASHAVTSYLPLTPSTLFYDFSADVEAKLICFNTVGEFKYVNTTALTDANCQTDISQSTGAADLTTFIAADHTCSEFDPAASTDFFAESLPAGGLSQNFAAMVVNGQPIGFIVDLSIDNTVTPFKWRTGIIYSEIVASRTFILQTANLPA